jgi:hypothetical protein
LCEARAAYILSATHERPVAHTVPERGRMRTLPPLPARRLRPNLLAPLGLTLLVWLSGCNCPGRGAVTCDPSLCNPGQECNPDTDQCEDISCIPGLTRCSATSAGGLERCNATGDNYIAVGACGPGQSCVMGATGGACDPPACAPGSAMCQADGSVSYCVVGVFENPVACPSGEVCDPSAGGTCVPTECGPNTLFCETGADVVRACNALGTGSTVVETCGTGDTCQAGTCFGMCDLAELQRSFVGCVYYGIDCNNDVNNDAGQYDIVVSNPNDTLSANVTIETRLGAGGAWSAVATDVVAPGTVRIFPLPDRHVEDTAIAPANAYRVTGDIPIVAWQFNSDDLNGSASSSGATILLPRSALGDFHYVMTSATSAPSFGGGLNNAGFAIVGTADGTNVTVTVSTNTLGAPGVPAMTAGDSYSTTLNEGDVFQIEAANIGDDPTSSYVTSDQPVAVFAYHETAKIDPAGPDDHTEEQMIPLEAWGTTFAAARMPLGNETHLWRIMASEDATTITFQYDAGVTGLPAPSGSSVVLNEAEYADFTVDGPAMVGFGGPVVGNIGDFYIASDKPILVGQWSMREPHYCLSVPIEQWLPDYLFIAPPFFADLITVVRRTSSTVTMDGAPIPAGQWSSFGPGVGPGLEVYRSTLTDGSHRIEGSAADKLMGPPEIYVVGEDGNCGYCYLGGLNVEIINPIE